jgi:anti-anti-sigma factor
MTSIQFNYHEKLNYDNVNEVFTNTNVWIKHQAETELVLDFSLVQFIDSAGVAMLVELRKLAEFKYKKSLILNISPAIQRMLEFYELEHLLDVVS